MRRPALYSRSSRAPGASAEPAEAPGAAGEATAVPARRRWRPTAFHLQWAAMTLLAVGLAVALTLALRPGAPRLTQEDIDAAVVRTLETTVLPSPAASAVANVAPSVVRVMGFVRNSPERRAAREKEEKAEQAARGQRNGNGARREGRNSNPPLLDPEAAAEASAEFLPNGVGTGVVIVDKGVILTNLHVVSGSDQIKVTFADGLETTASIVGVQPENDLAVLQAHKIPDDLQAATLRSTADLIPGEQVAAVGFPFGIGPSASAGVVSGLKRSFRSPEGKQEMSNLIQFDAAANPGNSGGPLVTMDGEVVGIVTAILNPTPARTFIGIGFAVPIENAAQAAGMPPF
ncbi:MAG: trypsin-like peptidase domain-containing protein [Burkholderiaceae bacterium]|nr:trypsin-like peptidase domain-containing protein [Burkholderiaceae bacterium]